MLRPRGGSASFFDTRQIPFDHGQKSIRYRYDRWSYSYAHDTRDIQARPEIGDNADVSFKLGQNNMDVMCDNK